MCFHYAPYEERDACDGYHRCFYSNQMPTRGELSVGHVYTPSFTRSHSHILWIGNQMAGREMSQKRKKHMKSRVVVPEEAGRWLAVRSRTSRRSRNYKGAKYARISLTLGHIALSMTNTHDPPMLACQQALRTKRFPEFTSPSAPVRHTIY